MTDEMSPSQFQILREDLATIRTEFNARLDNLVTRDSFRDERTRVDEAFRNQGREINELKQKLAAETKDRQTEASNSAQAQLHERNEREKVRRATSWQWFVIVVTVLTAAGSTVLGWALGHG